MEDAEVLQLYELDYADLMLLSSAGGESWSCTSGAEIERLESIATKIMENLGRPGPGLLAITGVPGASDLRQTLLPLARKLAFLNNDHRKRCLKEHNLGSDVSLKNLDRIVSSYATQLKYDLDSESIKVHSNGIRVDSNVTERELAVSETEGEARYDIAEFKNLGREFKKLGYCMMDIGLHLARVCDRAIGGQELEQSLVESGSAKGRLIHYHSIVDNVIIRDSAELRGKSRTKKTKQFTRNQQQVELPSNQSNLWQQWHYDYGIFTLLTAPMFLLTTDMEISAAGNAPYEQESHFPIGHTFLQIFHPEKDKVLMVNAPPESCIVQVGESADILTKGKLRATLHCVCRPEMMESLSRETFVVFLQPSWSKTFSLSDYPFDHSTPGCHPASSHNKQISNSKQEEDDLIQMIQQIVPPLSERMKDGMTFAEFSRETTKQYYGGNGLQSKRC